MKHFSLFAVLLIASISVNAQIHKVNGREIPQKEAFTGTGASFQNSMDQIDTLLTEVADILYSTEGADGIDVDSASITTATITTATIGTLSGVTSMMPKLDSVLVNTDGSETLTAAQSGILVVATKSDGATTVTLPDASASTVGCVFYVIQSANQNLVVTSTTADNNGFIADAVATSDQVSCETADHKIGSGVMIVGVDANSYAAFALNTECPLTVEAAD